MSTIRVIGRLIAIFTIVLFVGLFPIVMLAYNAQAAATSQGFLDSLTDDSRLFEAAFSMAAKGLARDVPADWETRNMPIARLNAAQWERILRTVTPPAMVQRLTRDALEDFGHWARYGGTFLEDLIVPYGEIRRNLVDDPNQTVLRIVTEAQPLCSAGQEPLSSPGDLIPRCRLVPSSQEAFYEALSRRWAQNPVQVWKQLWPDDANFYTEDMSVAELIRRENPEDWQGYRHAWLHNVLGLNVARGLLALLVIGSVIATLVTIALLAARNLPEALRWVGAPLLLVGLFTLGWGLLICAGGWIWPLVHIPVTDVPLEMQRALYGITRAYARSLLFPMAWQGIVLSMTGLTLWGSSFLMPKHRSVASAAMAATQ
jgi:hypothetical protein